jgi:type VI secretion system secreted protein Hcp
MLALVPCAASLLYAASVQAAPVICVTIVAQKQNVLGAATKRPGACGSKIEATSFSYGVISPRDAATGMATGRRQHKPVRIKKEWSSASPQLFQALVSNELLTSVTLDFVLPDPATGQMLLDHSIKLTNAFITSIEHASDTYQSNEQPSRLNATETVELTFQKIELIDSKGQTSATDGMQIN